MKPPVFNPHWPADVKALFHHDLEEIWDRSISPHLWNQTHNQIATYSQIAGINPLDILDVGCAQATLALLLAEKGHRVTAIDIRPQFLDYARSRYTSGDIQFLSANVLEDALPGTFDLIFANQIIEHLVYPVDLVRRLSAALRPGGCIVITTPNGEYLMNTLPCFKELGDPANWEHMQHTADGDGHFYAYLQSELKEVFRKAGLYNVKIKFFETPWISGHMKVRYLHGLCPPVLLKTLDQLTLKSSFLARHLSHQLMIIGTRDT